MDSLLELFIREPEREFHVREIARLIKKSPTTVSAHLKNYEKKNVLKSSRKLNHLLFKANTESRLFKQFKLNYNLEILHSSGLIERLEEEFNHPEAIGIFGSFAKADNIEQSDVDVFIISPLKKEINLKKHEKKIRYKVQLFVFSRQDIEKMKKSNKELLNNITNGIILSGHLEVIK